MKLQFLIPQYHETDDVVRPMLQSIATQQGVDLHDIEVIIGNDGSDVKLSEEMLGSFPFGVKYLQFEHSNIPGCRGKLFDASSADYVMFCDADDMLLTNIALHTIFTYMDNGTEVLVCGFLEEVKDRSTGKSRFVHHKRDCVFVHGKVFNRKYLVDNNIIWHPELRRHEDSCFNILAQKVAKKLEFYETPLYLWKWRDDSICRGDPLYVLKTYNCLIDSNAKLIQNFLERGMVKEAAIHANILLYGTYLMLNKPIWMDPNNSKYRHDTELYFRDYLKKYKGLIESINPQDKTRVIRGQRARALREGVLLEKFTFSQWLKHLEGIS